VGVFLRFLHLPVSSFLPFKKRKSMISSQGE
jgi:hypothetical protein